MFKAEVDKPKNLLKLTYAQHVTPEDTSRGLEQLQLLLSDLPPGFRLLADFSTLETMDLACVPHLDRMMDLCNTKGVAEIVRIMPDPHKDIGLNIMSPFHYCRNVRIVTTETAEEAMQLLEIKS